MSLWKRRKESTLAESPEPVTEDNLSESAESASGGRVLVMEAFAGRIDDPNPPDCPICVSLDNTNIIKRRKRKPIGKVQSGAGSYTGPNGSYMSWGACYEHADVINALYWLILNREMDSPFYGDDIWRYMREENNKYCGEPCCRDDEGVDSSTD